MPTIIIGLDPSSRKIAMVYARYGATESLHSKVIALPQDVIPALALAYKATRRMVKRYVDQGAEVVLCIEEPVVGKGGPYATIKQSKVHGAIVAGAVAGGARVSAVQNTTWKKSVTGKGNHGKVQVAQYVRKNWRNLSKLAGPDQDLIDAGCIYAHAVKLYDEERSLK